MSARLGSARVRFAAQRYGWCCRRGRGRAARLAGVWRRRPAGVRAQVGALAAVAAAGRARPGRPAPRLRRTRRRDRQVQVPTLISFHHHHTLYFTLL